MRKMRAALAHRGPDGDGEYVSSHVALGMQRLSIIDVHGGWQPLYNEDRSLSLVANGEIYNFVELRAELQAAGHRFRTRSDCETILHLYEESGLDCVHRLHGMFAFALWDSTRDRLLLARDRVGEKPLYLYQSTDTLLFASELKALVACGRIPLELDPDAVNLYFHYQFVPEPRTPLSGVRKLPAGHLLTVDVRSWQIAQRCYWHMEQAPAIQDDPVPRIRDELETVGRIVSRSDVPVGVALSGGLDSSVVAALIARNSAEPVHAFTVGYQGHPANDERAQARELATTLGLRFHEIELDEAAVVTSFPALVRAWDDPIADMSGFGYQAIARLVQQHGIRVLVQGHGGDELFWGYPWVRRAMDASLARAALWQRSWRALPTYASSALPGRCGAMEEAGLPGPATRLVRALRHLQQDARAPRRRLRFYDLHPDFRMAAAATTRLYTDEIRSRIDPDAPFSLFTVSPPFDHLGVTVTRLITQTYLLENGIAQGDRLSMASSVELRLPLVDYRLVETVIGLRKHQPDHGRPAKHWLAQAARDLVPPAIVDRRKRPFLTPLRAWQRALFRSYGPLLADGHLVDHRVLSAGAARALAAGPFPADAGSPLSFKALVLELWCRTLWHPQQELSPIPAVTGSSRG